MFKKDPLQEAINTARRSEAYLVMISRRQGEKLFHTYITRNFKKDDLMPSLDEHRFQIRKKEL